MTDPATDGGAYEHPGYNFAKAGGGSTDHRAALMDRAGMVAAFLGDLLARDRLDIARYLPRMTQDPFFLVAATGLGKTVAVPIHVWLRQCERAANEVPTEQPRVWVVEPRVPIAEDQAAYMASLYRKFLSETGRRDSSPLFGSITSNLGRVSKNASIMFVTTGIFALLARSKEFDGSRDRVIIDEAHVTIEQNAEVEIAIAQARQAGVTVDYMSATIDTASLQETLGVENVISADEGRFPIWLHNLGAPVEEVIVDVVRTVLLDQERTSDLLPGDSYEFCDQIRGDVLASGRSHGLLVVINSFAGEQSDARRLAAKIEAAPYNSPEPQVEVLQLASRIVRDTVALARFSERLDRIEASTRPYVILATSVVEMGVTFPTLDFVITMDSGYTNRTLGDREVPVLGPLGVNSLKQRIGRVGRRRSGVGYISNEVGAPYSELSDDELNKGGLAFEPIRPPLQTAPSITLAMHTFREGWRDVDAVVHGLHEMELPSRATVVTSDGVRKVLEERKRLIGFGIASEDGELTPLGRNCDQWVGAGDLAYAIELEKELLVDDPDDQALLFWLTALGGSYTSLSSLVTPGDSYWPTPERIKVSGPPTISFSHVSELVALYELVSHLVRTYGYALGTTRLGIVRRAARERMALDCESLGLAAPRVTSTLDGIEQVMKRFAEIHRRQPHFKRRFGESQSLPLDGGDWAPLSDADVRYYRSLIAGMVGRTEFRCERGTHGLQLVDIAGTAWCSMDQRSSPLPLAPGCIYTGKVQSRISRAGNEIVEAVHLELVDPATRL